MSDTDLDRLDPSPSRLHAATPATTLADALQDTALQAERSHVVDRLMVLHRRRWPALTVFLLVVLYAVVDTFTATPVFEARARLLIEPGKPNIVSFQEVLEESQARTDYYETQYNLLRSRTLARRTLGVLNLWTREPFGGATPASAFSFRRTIESSIAWMTARVTGLFRSGLPPQSTAPDETVAQSRAIDTLLGSLGVSPLRNSRMVDVTFRSPDPKLAAEIVNAHAKGYIEQTMEFRFLTSKEAADWLSARLAESRKQVEAAEYALQRYRERNDAISLEDGDNIVVQRLTDMSVALTRAKTERIEKEAVYQQYAALQNNPAALDALPAILNNAYLQQQKLELANLQRQEAQFAQKLGDRHPDMERIRSTIKSAQTKLQAEVAKVMQSIRSDFISSLAQERSLAEALEGQRREALAMNQKAIEFGVLRREAESARQIYESLLQRAKEMGVSTELRTSSIRIIDPAEIPRTPASPNKRMDVLRGLGAGLALALAVAFLFEYLDDRIRRPDEIKQHLGLPVLGIVPLASGKDARPFPLLTGNVPAVFMEAVRTVRTNLLFASAEEGSRSVVVTSTDPSEGKTLVASNLAIAFAQAGHRVLLVDADMRRPKVHERFSIAAEPGLSNLLVGSAKASEAVRKISGLSLWALPAGRVPPNPTELLGSKRFTDFVRSLRDHFDWVILDTPPVLAVTDAAVAAHAASGAVLVIGADMVSRRAARAALEHLASAKVSVLGVVLNKVDLERQAYYYSHYYRREYSRYYVRRA